MTQEELRKEISRIIYADQEAYSVDMDALVALINQHVAEVIGEDEKPKGMTNPLMVERNSLRAEQRKRAGI